MGEVVHLHPGERVEITAGLTTIYAVRVDTVIWPGAEFNSSTLACRCAAHLNDLAALGALPSPRHPGVRSMLADTLRTMNHEG